MQLLKNLNLISKNQSWIRQRVPWPIDDEYFMELNGIGVVFNPYDKTISVSDAY